MKWRRHLSTRLGSLGWFACRGWRRPVRGNDELELLEQFIRWHNDMDINVEGIEALHHMLMRVKLLQAEIDSLKNELQFYRSLI